MVGETQLGDDRKIVGPPPEPKIGKPVPRPSSPRGTVQVRIIDRPSTPNSV